LSPPAAPPRYEIKFIEYAAAQARALDGSIKKPFKNLCLKKLAVNPHGYGTELRAPLTGFWKHEFRTHRVIYRIYPDLLLVVVCVVGPRKQGDVADVYAQLAPLVKAGKIAEQLSAIIKLKR
jgi:mRNA-degrading endonuclease RelE of RelBE toxin-antitoxin system